MSHKRYLKNPDDPRIKIEELVSFHQAKDPLELSREEKHSGAVDPGLLSKYRTVLCCSFVNGTKSSASAERTAAKRR